MSEKNMLVLLATAAVLTLCTSCFVIDAETTDGEDGLIEIESYDELTLIGVDAAYPLSGHYVLKKDISAPKDKLFIPIGTDNGMPKSPFTGIFDGRGHIISGLNIDIEGKEDNASAGLFGYVGGSAKISNLGVVDSTVIMNVSAYRAYAGGLIGSIEDNFNASVSIINSYHTGTITMIGKMPESGEIIGSLARYTFTGGLVGYTASASISISNSYNTGNIMVYGFESRTNSGGLIGYAETATAVTISDSYNTGNIFASSSYTKYPYAGGLVGSIKNGSVTYSYNTGNIEVLAEAAALYCGGLFGNAIETSTSQCFNTGNIRAIATSHGLISAGGLIGYAQTGLVPIENSYNTGNVVGSAPKGVINSGGIVGDMWSKLSSIKNSYNIGNITANGGSVSHAGGLLGNTDHSDQKLISESSYFEAYMLTVNDKSANDSIVGNIDDKQAASDFSGARVTADMKDQGTFVGWNFRSIWKIDHASGNPINNGYPYLSESKDAFVEYKVTITVEEAMKLSVDPSPSKSPIMVKEGSVFSLTVSPMSNAVDVLVNDKSVRDEMVDGRYTVESMNKDLVIQIVSIPCIKVNVTSTDGGTAKIASPVGIIVPGDTVIVTFNQNNGYMLSNVLVDRVSNPDAVITGTLVIENIVSDTDVHGVFTIESKPVVEKTITVAISSTEGGTTNPASKVNVEYGGALTITFVPESGYMLSDVLVNGQSNTPAKDLKKLFLSNLTSNVSVIGIFTQTTDMAYLSVVAEDGGKAHGTGYYEEGSTVSVYAEPNSGYSFDKWSDGSTDQTHSVVVNGDTIITAFFTKNDSGLLDLSDTALLIMIAAALLFLALLIFLILLARKKKKDKEEV